jgi:WD40 repeat protein
MRLSLTGSNAPFPTNRWITFIWCLLASLGTFLMVAGCDGPPAPKLINSIDSTNPAGKVQFSPDGTILVIQDGGDGLIVWDVNGRRIKSRFNKVARVSVDFAFTADGKRLILGDISKVRALDLATGHSVVLYGHDGDVNCVACSPNGQIIASSHSKGNVKLWDPVAGKQLSTFHGEAAIDQLVFSPDSTTLVAGGGTVVVPTFGCIWLWHVGEMDKKPRTLKEGYVHPVNVLALSPDGKALATPGEAEDVWLWDIQQEKIKAKWKPGFKVMDAITFSPDGRTLLVGGGDGNTFRGLNFNPGKVAFFDTATGKKLHTLDALDDLVRCVAVSPDGKLLAVSNDGSLKTVKIWDVSSIINRAP